MKKTKKIKTGVMSVTSDANTKLSICFTSIDAFAPKCVTSEVRNLCQHKIVSIQTHETVDFVNLRWAGLDV